MLLDKNSFQRFLQNEVTQKKAPVIFPRCKQAFGRIKIVRSALQPKLNMFFGFHFLRMAALRIFDIIARIRHIRILSLRVCLVHTHWDIHLPVI